VPLSDWVRSSGDALFVIGLCVVAFVKFTFLSILRYEIKEMIQKIRLMQNETQQVTEASFFEGRVARWFLFKPKIPIWVNF
jgi:type II secretory pathway component PulF